MILGDMLELGEASSASHLEVADAVSRLVAIDLAVFVGPQFAEASSVVERRRTIPRVVRHAAIDEQRAGEIAALLHAHDRVLLKGSRGMGLERIVKALRSAEPPRPQGHGFLEEAPDPRAHA